MLICFSSCSEKSSTPQQSTEELDILLKSIGNSPPSEIDTASQGKVVGFFNVSTDEEGKTNINSTRLMDPSKAEYQQVIKKSLPDDNCRHNDSGEPSFSGNKTVTLINGNYNISLKSPKGKLNIAFVRPGENFIANENVALQENQKYSLVVSPANLNFNVSVLESGGTVPNVAPSTSGDVSKTLLAKPEQFSMSFDEQTLFDFDPLPQVTFQNVSFRIKDIAELTWAADTDHQYGIVTVYITVSRPKDPKQNRLGATIECDLSADAGNLKGVKNLDVMQRIAELADPLYQSFSIRIVRTMPAQKQSFSYKLDNVNKEGVVVLEQRSATQHPKEISSESVPLESSGEPSN